MENVLTVVAKIYPKAGKEDDLAALLVKMADAVRQAEPDCLVYRPHRAAKDPAVFLFYEQYRSRAAFEFHRPAPAASRGRKVPSAVHNPALRGGGHAPGSGPQTVFRRPRWSKRSAGAFVCPGAAREEGIIGLEANA